MAGDGQRFKEKGYTVHKPAIPVTDLRSGKKIPMVIGATKDLPGVWEDGGNLIYIGRDFHIKDGVERMIHTYYPAARFLTTDGLTQGQACTCLLAKEWINTQEELLIAGCDNGMALRRGSFEEAKEKSDCLVFVYRHNASVCFKPDAYGWAAAKPDGLVEQLSIKKALSDHPMEDYAIVATFWFRSGKIFIDAAEKMIECGDRIKGEFYVDQAIRYVIDAGYSVRILEVERYIGWGTPLDYEEYEQAFSYWRKFVRDERFLGKCGKK